MTDRTEINLGGSDFGDRLQEAGFSVVTGWSDEIAEQLRDRSLEPAIKAATPRDYKERFVDVDAANAWYQKREKIVYALGSTSGLAGVVWFSSEQYENAMKTFAIRLYGEARGRKLSDAFAMVAHRHLASELEYSGDTWLETGLGNLTAQHLFRRVGYEFHLDPNTDPGRVKMIRPGTASMLVERGDSVR